VRTRGQGKLGTNFGFKSKINFGKILMHFLCFFCWGVGSKNGTKFGSKFGTNFGPLSMFWLGGPKLVPNVEPILCITMLLNANVDLCMHVCLSVCLHVCMYVFV
jgi:hypothetical protein